MELKSKLRSYQVEPVRWLAKQSRGLLIAPAGSGKTRMALTALDDAWIPESRILWLAHTREQVAQAEAAMNDVCPHLICHIKFGCYAGMDDAELLQSKYNHIICDEAHHLSRSSWGKVIEKLGDIKIWFLTATPWSGDEEGDNKLRLLVKNQYPLSLDAVREAGGLVETKVIWCGPHEPNFILQKKVDKEVEYRTEKVIRWNKRISHATAKQRAIWLVNHKDGVVENYARNKLIVENTRFTMQATPNPSVLVLVNHVAHAERLIELSGGLFDDCLVHGKTPLKLRREKLKDFVEGRRSLLLGTVSLFGEGFDAPAMTHVVNAAGGKSPIAVVQRAGRSSRTSANKSCGYVIDFQDKHLKTLSNHAEERRKIYSSLGYSHHNYEYNEHQ